MWRRHPRHRCGATDAIADVEVDTSMTTRALKLLGGAEEGAYADALGALREDTLGGGRRHWLRRPRSGIEMESPMQPAQPRCSCS